MNSHYVYNPVKYDQKDTGGKFLWRFSISLKGLY